MITQLEQWGKLLLVEFLDPNGDVVQQHEVEERPLLVGELRVNEVLGVRRSLLSGEWRKGIRDMGLSCSVVRSGLPALR